MPPQGQKACQPEAMRSSGDIGRPADCHWPEAAAMLVVADLPDVRQRGVSGYLSGASCPDTSVLMMAAGTARR
jgi:hypothetical protein